MLTDARSFPMLAPGWIHFLLWDEYEWTVFPDRPRIHAKYLNLTLIIINASGALTCSNLNSTLLIQSLIQVLQEADSDVREDPDPVCKGQARSLRCCVIFSYSGGIQTWSAPINEIRSIAAGVDTQVKYSTNDT